MQQPTRVTYRAIQAPRISLSRLLGPDPCHRLLALPAQTMLRRLWQCRASPVPPCPSTAPGSAQAIGMAPTTAKPPRSGARADRPRTLGRRCSPGSPVRAPPITITLTPGDLATGPSNLRSARAGDSVPHRSPPTMSSASARPAGHRACRGGPAAAVCRPAPALLSVWDGPLGGFGGGDSATTPTQPRIPCA